jgi:thiol-disulfide isomerase/thioredoxin
MVIYRVVIAFVLIFMGFLTTFAQEQRISIITFEQLDNRFEQRDSGKIRVFNFWATWCKPCVEELPYFLSLPDTINGKSAELILVSLDFKSHFAQRLIPFAQKHNINREIVLLDAGNPNKWIDKVDPDWSGAIPATLFIGEDVRLFREKSYDSMEEIMEDIRLLIKN